ncbi:protein phosphatase 2C domain-containing protein [Limnoglobus roseus]|uniref:Uncharacterized protein n=1 Tax=Limnoglobus roseus TaxID=2598579 RepID=A0A5C1AQB4_9BACT|nr:protein phosphatase 2C domain-containing protein [Limnoglobus roseus]QEL20243.1 hypothetical protein PX52LOC_07335 [Limnoglobus roseus]
MAFSLDIVVRTTPKAGNTDAQNEDAAAVAPKLRRAAVADGASEGWQSGPWAKVIATAYAKTLPEPTTFESWVATVREQAPRSESKSWYAEEKQALGAFSTLIGVTFEETKDGGIKWRALAVGDSCLFQVRGAKLLAKFPVESVADFSNRPRLIGSVDVPAVPEAEWFAGRAELGDVFYLLTDAVAEWFLKTREANGTPWTELDRVTTSSLPPAAFAFWIKSLRDAKMMRNDDSTAMRITLSPGEHEQDSP